MTGQSANIFVHIAMGGWVPLVLAMFVLMPPRRAVIASFVLGWLFLPMYAYQFQGLPNFTKMSAPAIAALLGAVIFDTSRIATFRPRLADIPMLVWLLVPIPTAMANGLPGYDGLSGVVNLTLQWGLAYFLGRIYFTDLEALRELALGFVIGGLLYVPLCLYEARMSPQLHASVYGYQQHAWNQVRRFEGWRPMVFLQHGLAVGMLMATAAVTAAWLWAAGSVRSIAGLPMAAAALLLLATAVLCKSLLSVLLMALGLGVLMGTRALGTRALVAMLVLIAPVYVIARTSGNWSGDAIIQAAGMIDESRGASLRTRIASEEVLWGRAREQMVWGWGGYGRNMVFDAAGNQAAIPDGMWIITAGKHGVVGLTALMGIFLVPPLMLLWRLPGRWWPHARAAPATAMAVVLSLHMADNLFNAMLNPIFILMSGALIAAMGHPRGAARRVVARRAGAERPAPAARSTA